MIVYFVTKSFAGGIAENDVITNISVEFEL